VRLSLRRLHSTPHRTPGTLRNEQTRAALPSCGNSPKRIESSQRTKSMPKRSVISSTVCSPRKASAASAVYDPSGAVRAITPGLPLRNSSKNRPPKGAARRKKSGANPPAICWRRGFPTHPQPYSLPVPTGWEIFWHRSWSFLDADLVQARVHRPPFRAPALVSHAVGFRRFSHRSCLNYGCAGNFRRSPRQNTPLIGFRHDYAPVCQIGSRGPPKKDGCSKADTQTEARPWHQI